MKLSEQAVACLRDWTDLSKQLHDAEDQVTAARQKLVNLESRLNNLTTKMAAELNLVNNDKRELFLQVVIEDTVQTFHLVWRDGKVVIRIVQVEESS